MSRRCVVCGKEVAESAGESTCHYPKTKQEARIWQQSMGALDTSVECIQKYCCVCIEHIPEFVERTQQQAVLIKDNNKEGTPQMARTSLKVLLLSGATLPAYCGKSNKTASEAEMGLEDDDLDDEICVRESNYRDCGVCFPDIDETEVTVLCTPMHNDEELKQLAKTDKECGDIGSMRNCTDVLLLGRAQNHPTDKCPCKCEQCLKTNVSPDNPRCCPELQMQYSQLPDDSECHCQTHQKLSEVIEQQQQRILELESLLFRQNDWYMTLQHKMDEMYSDFGSVENTGDVSRLVTLFPCNECQEQEQTNSPVQWEKECVLPSKSKRTAHMEQKSSSPQVRAHNRVKWHDHRSQVNEEADQTITSNNPRSNVRIMQPKKSN